MTKKAADLNENNSIDFDTSLDQLQAQVDRMEKNELTLEESLQEFERGIKLTRDAQKALSNAEQRVQLLLEKDDVLTAKDLDEELLT